MDYSSCLQVYKVLVSLDPRLTLGGFVAKSEAMALSWKSVRKELRERHGEFKVSQVFVHKVGDRVRD